MHPLGICSAVKMRFREKEENEKKKQKEGEKGMMGCYSELLCGWMERGLLQYPAFLRYSAMVNAFLLSCPPWIPSFPMTTTNTGGT